MLLLYIHIHNFLWTHVFIPIGYITRNNISRSYGKYILIFWGNTKLFLKVFFQISHSHNQCMRVPISPHSLVIVNIYAPNIGEYKPKKQIFTNIKKEIDSSIVILGDLNISLTSMNRSSRQKITSYNERQRKTQQFHFWVLFKEMQNKNSKRHMHP